jgi:hypothetical protein
MLHNVYMGGDGFCGIGGRWRGGGRGEMGGGEEGGGGEGKGRGEVGGYPGQSGGYVG